jgi:hypothetical protein
MEDLASPVRHSVRERRVVGTGDGFRVGVEVLYGEWKRWCDAHGRTSVGTLETFGRDLRSAESSVKKIRPRTSDGRAYCYEGIRLRDLFESNDVREALGLGPGGPGGRSDRPIHTIALKFRPEAEEVAEERQVVNALIGRCDHPDHPDHTGEASSWV